LAYSVREKNLAKATAVFCDTLRCRSASRKVTVISASDGGAEIAEVDIAAPSSRGGHRGSGHWGSSKTAISSDQNQRQIKGICLINVFPNTAEMLSCWDGCRVSGVSWYDHDGDAYFSL